MRRADRRDGRRDEAIDTNPLTPPNTLTHPPNPHIPSNPRTRPMCSGFPHVISRIAVVVECRPQSRVIKPKPKQRVPLVPLVAVVAVSPSATAYHTRGNLQAEALWVRPVYMK